MNLAELQNRAIAILDTLIGWLTSPQFYAQMGAIAVAVAAAWFAARLIRRRIAFFREPPGAGRLFKLRHLAFASQGLLFPVLCVLALGIAATAAAAALGSSWLILLAQSAAVVGVLYAAINRFVTHPLIGAACRWILIPVAALQVFGVLDDVTAYLDQVAIEAGNIRLSALALVKAALFGGVLFWLGRASTTAGQKVIREQQEIDVQTRELFAKLFEIVVFFVVIILLLQLLGLDLTALAVFGGALGVGIGFGLQQIAANFISGIIILLERSLKVGDYIEIEGGSAGMLKEINMRSSTLATFDGKEVMVPNEKFITAAITNWTRTDPLQRYEVPFAVSYDTDIHRVPPLIEAAVAKHPDVLQRPEPPDCEIRSFGDSGINFAVEFWVSGIDDGKNKFTSDVHFLVWDALKAAGITMPFPQCDIRIIGGDGRSVMGQGA
jgi:small-conductance mechanosensitive channel